MSDDIAAPVRHRQFPARVTGPDRTIDRARAIMTTTGLFVYALVGDRPHQTVQTVLAIDPYVEIKNTPGGWLVVDQHGGEWTIKKGSGCGCKSPLTRIGATPLKYLGVNPEDVRV